MLVCKWTPASYRPSTEKPGRGCYLLRLLQLSSCSSKLLFVSFPFLVTAYSVFYCTGSLGQVQLQCVACGLPEEQPGHCMKKSYLKCSDEYNSCVLCVSCGSVDRGRILRQNPEKSLKKFPPCYSQSPRQLCLEISISSNSRNLLQFLQFSNCTL